MADASIWFYIPACLWPEALPKHPSENWSGFGLGIYAWTVQTFLWLQEAGVACALTDRLPDEGIVFIHRNGFRCHPRGIPWLPRRLLVCFQGDVQPHPDAQVHIVQNRSQEHPRSGAYFMPHWPQPGLQPRDPNRGDRFTTVSFLGHQSSLAPELTTPEWQQALSALGLQWRPIINANRWNDHHTLDTRWNDYRTIDAVVAVRTFDAIALAHHRHYQHKPATKLYNAWLARVPAVLGVELGYQSERQSPLDYLEASSLSQVLEALTRLRDDRALRQAISQNGQRRSHAYTPAVITQRWQQLIQTTLIPAYDQWCRQTPWQQKLMAYGSKLSYGAQRLQQRWHDWQYVSREQS